jgi:hypothetical protein
MSTVSMSLSSSATQWLNSEPLKATGCNGVLVRQGRRAEHVGGGAPIRCMSMSSGIAGLIAYEIV